MRIVVVGGGPGGLGAAVPLAAAGHQVTVLDRDPAPPENDEQAWESWARRSVPQVRQPHFILGRFFQEVARTAPSLRDAIEESGGTIVRFGADPELLGMGIRRTTLERVLRDWVTRETTVDLRCGVAVAGLTADEATVPRVTGVRLDDGSVIEADLVVAATGRHGAACSWLAEIGAGPTEESEADGGLAYYSRYFRYAPGAGRPPWFGPGNVDCGSFGVFHFPADADTFTLACAPLSDDVAMRGVLDDDAFLRLMQLVPTTAAWLHDAEPITSVARLGRIEDRRRRLVVNGALAATGIVLTADAAFCTNPVLGRGTSIAWLMGRRLAETVDTYGDDVEKIALALDEIGEQELRPWYEDSLAQDRERFARYRAIAAGQPAPELDFTDVRRRNLAAVEYAMSDPRVAHASGRRFNLLDPLDAIHANTDVLDRAYALWDARDPSPAAPTYPAREDVLAVLAG